jgi:hypothetical protein
MKDEQFQGYILCESLNQYMFLCFFFKTLMKLRIILEKQDVSRKIGMGRRWLYSHFKKFVFSNCIIKAQNCPSNV